MRRNLTKDEIDDLLNLMATRMGEFAKAHAEAVARLQAEVSKLKHRIATLEEEGQPAAASSNAKRQSRRRGKA